MNQQQSFYHQFNVRISEKESTEEICIKDQEFSKYCFDTRMLLQKYCLKSDKFIAHEKLKLRNPIRYYFQPLDAVQQTKQETLKRNDGCHKSYVKSPRFLQRTHNNQ